MAMAAGHHSNDIRGHFIVRQFFGVLYQISATATHFTGAIFSVGKARVVPWYMYHKRRAT